MDDDIKQKMTDNILAYKRTLDRITEKYLKFSEHDGGIEIDFKNTNDRELEHQMTRLESKLENLCHESKTEGCSDQNSDSVLDGASEIENTRSTVDLLDETQGNLTEALLQPEDQDEHLERSLSSHGNSLIELYPSMITKFGKAYHREHVIVAADSVLRRYNRMRQTNHRKTINSKTMLSGPHCRNQSFDEPYPRTSAVISAAVVHSPSQRMTKQVDVQDKHSYPAREVDRVERVQRRPVLLMDYCSSEANQVSLNQTFTVSEGSAYCSSPSGSPWRRGRSSAVGSCFKRDEGSSHSMMGKPTVPNSPARQQDSFTRWWNQEDVGESPNAFTRCPPSDSRYGFSRQEKRTKYNPASPSSSLHMPLLSPRRLYHQDCDSPSQLKFDSAACSRRDSSLWINSGTLSSVKLDEEFIRVYHKFVCQGRSPSSNLPTLCCCKRAETSRGCSSSTLAALALSPHRSVSLRKRFRELDQDDFPQSKRLRDWPSTSSPGSLRHRQENLRHSRYLSNASVFSTRLESSGGNGSQSRARASLVFSCQQPSKETLPGLFGGKLRNQQDFPSDFKLSRS